jgi:hypothetical protein
MPDIREQLIRMALKDRRRHNFLRRKKLTQGHFIFFQTLPLDESRYNATSQFVVMCHGKLHQHI